MSTSPVQPPVPFADFEFSFDPALSSLFPQPPPLPPSADLFSASETTDLLGFLDNFNWEFDSELGAAPQPEQLQQQQQKVLPPYSNPHLDTTPEPSTSNKQRVTRSASTRRASTAAQKDAQNSTSSSAIESKAPEPAPTPRPKTLLSTPQKRLNHIMSEQKRRNAIRDGYAQLITLLAPAGTPHGMGMPTRGRPKGSGSRGKGTTKGKSGVLFRAVEYCRWLEEGRNALKEEVERLEPAAGIRHPARDAS